MNFTGQTIKPALIRTDEKNVQIVSHKLGRYFLNLHRTAFMFVTLNLCDKNKWPKLFNTSPASKSFPLIQILCVPLLSSPLQAARIDNTAAHRGALRLIFIPSHPSTIIIHSFRFAPHWFFPPVLCREAIHTRMKNNISALKCHFPPCCWEEQISAETESSAARL